MIGLHTMKKQVQKCLLLLSFALLLNPAMAQNNDNGLTINVALDTNVITIGDQIHLNLSIDQPEGIAIDFPTFNNNITENIEIIRQWPLDTSLNKNGNIKLNKRYLITSFDGGIHKIPPFAFTLNGENINKIIRTDTLMLGVNSFEIDTTKSNFDIAMPIHTPISFAEIVPWAMGVLLFILILLTAYYFYRRYKRNQPLFKAKIPEEPAHVIALRKLDEIDNQKLWQAGKVKQYHSDLTDAIRNYLDNRFNLNTLESTTDETMHLISEDIMPKDAITDLRIILERADLVKFAKAQPLPDENQMSLKYAYRIVEKTLVKKTEIEDVDETESDPVELTKEEENKLV